LLPPSVSVPVPVLLNAPVPPIAWEIVVEKPLVSMLPPPALSVIVRVLDRLKLAPSCRVPPPKASARPHCRRCRPTETMPPLMAVPPV
jgi:hypothetical protein